MAGRLGLVRAVEDTPVGPLAVYRHGGGVVAVCDVCPHARARLSEGSLEGGVITCPAHGSRFEVATGVRVRGPADAGLATYTVVVEGGRVWLVWL
ncbi:Rieske 2Fe-2S domain-containing protein [Acidimicrobiaceae bacterium USS-CC1]|uniref:Rieske 2Fe-2S domain-containing protein n=1 Tax=Acidiferrimicrobium australe TaxID=2664430 RepID=A0ABW9QQ29_9ACTN|nr:Rieske 2Fe-2S domain-containing protein [Acidiferrimicrobium australe]